MWEDTSRVSGSEKFFSGTWMNNRKGVYYISLFTCERGRHMETKTILVIEDNEFNMKLLRTLLQLESYEVVEAKNAEKGLFQAKDLIPDLILMDMQLPGIDGYQATRMIKNDPDLRHVPVVAVTAYALEADEQKAFQAGCNAYLSKPFDTQQFMEVVQKYLEAEPVF